MVTILGLQEILTRDNGELNVALSEFSCRDKDVELFLKERAIINEKRHKSRTYLVAETNKDGSVCSPLKILAYFSLAFKVLDFNDTVSKTAVKEIDGFNKNASAASVMLIGQIGKDEHNGACLHGNDILDICFEIFKEIQQRAGGRIVLLECRPIDKLVKFYENYGFKHLQTDQNDTYLQLFRQL